MRSAQRSEDEVATITGRTADGRIETVRVIPEGSPVANYAFDVTPARLVTGAGRVTGGSRGAGRRVSGAEEGALRRRPKTVLFIAMGDTEGIRRRWSCPVGPPKQQSQT